MKPNIESIPCFNEVARVIGRTQARIELFKAVGWKNSAKKCGFRRSIKLMGSFGWENTPQSFYFWDYIDEGINPYTGERMV